LLVYLQDALGVLRARHRKRFGDTLISDEDGFVLPACNNSAPIAAAAGFRFRQEVDAARKIVRRSED